MLILASTSIYRKELLERLPYSFTVAKPNYDEELGKEQFKKQFPLASPQKLAEHLALQKARSIQVDKFSLPIVVGSDQLVVVGDQIIGKPGNREKAIAQLQTLNGHTHHLITAVCIKSSDAEVVFTNIATMKMRFLTVEEMIQYVDKDQPWDCAGSCKLEKSGISLFSEIICSDWTAIQGLPLLQLHQELLRLGIKKN